MGRTSWLLFAAVAAIVALVAVFAVVSRAPVPETAGTAPSVITNTTGDEARPVTAPPESREPRETEASGSSGRAARGSGIEGMSSGGFTTDPPSGR